LNLSDDYQEVSHKRGIVLRAIDKLDRLGFDGVDQLLKLGREDESGDFSEGAKLSDFQSQLIIEFLQSSGTTNQKTLENIHKLVKRSETGREGVTELEHMCEYCEAGGFSNNKISVDPTVVRGLGYYTGPVFEAQLTFDIFDDKGRKRQFGSVAGGGRYDDLVKRFTGQIVPATGVSVGVDRLLSALRECEASKNINHGPILVTVMDKKLVSYYQAIVQELRKNNIRSEMFLGNPKDLGRQLKYADQRDSPVAVIVGSEELDRDIIQLKDLDLGSKLSK
jgi:histidyl-tRNA synthetase